VFQESAREAAGVLWTIFERRNEVKITKEFIDYTDRHGKRGFWRWDHFESLSDYREIKGGKSWDKTYSHQKSAEFDALAAAGWSEGVKQALQNLSALDIPILPDFRRKLQRDQDGDDLDISAVWSGNLDKAWTVAKRVSFDGRPKFVRLLSEVTLHGCHGSDEAFWRGACTIALADALEHAGIPTEIWGFSSGTSAIGHNKHVMVSFCIHDAGEPLNLAKIALLAHPSMERYYSFRALSAVKGATGIGGCYPWPFELESGDILIDQVFSKEEAQAKIAEVLQGVRSSIQNRWSEMYGGINAAWENNCDVDKTLATE
jgi:hypothetical protein